MSNFKVINGLLHFTLCKNEENKERNEEICLNGQIKMKEMNWTEEFV